MCVAVQNAAEGPLVRLGTCVLTLVVSPYPYTLYHGLVTDALSSDALRFWMIPHVDQRCCRSIKKILSPLQQQHIRTLPTSSRAESMCRRFP